MGLLLGDSRRQEQGEGHGRRFWFEVEPHLGRLNLGKSGFRMEGLQLFTIRLFAIETEKRAPKSLPGGRLGAPGGACGGRIYKKNGFKTGPRRGHDTLHYFFFGPEGPQSRSKRHLRRLPNRSSGPGSLRGAPGASPGPMLERLGPSREGFSMVSVVSRGCF